MKKLLLFLALTLPVSSAEKKFELVTDPRAAYMDPVSKSGLLTLCTCPLDVVQQIEELTWSARVTRVGDWGDNESYMLTKNSNGYAIYHRKMRIIDQLYPAVVKNSKSVEAEDALVASKAIDTFFAEAKKGLHHDEKEEIQLNNNTPFFLLELISAKEYRAVLMTPEEYTHFKGKAEAIISLFSTLLDK